jgi:hypothetical protein
VPKDGSEAYMSHTITVEEGHPHKGEPKIDIRIAFIREGEENIEQPSIQD